MSSYLSFRKGGVYLCSYSRNTQMYQAFPTAPCGDWEKVTPDRLRKGLDELNETKRDLERARSTYEEALKHQMAYDDLISTINSVRDFNDELAEVERAISQLLLLIDIAGDDEYGKEKYDFEWSVG